MRNKLTLIALLTLAQTGFADQANTRQITILGTSDIHGFYMPWDYAADVENLSGSLSQVATKVKEIRAENPDTILVDVGDIIQGNFIETFKANPISPMMLGLNEMQYDIWVMGNHEFDFGLDVLNTSLQQFKGKALAGNIKKGDGTSFLPTTHIIEKSGIKIGLIGVSTPMTQVFAEGSDRLGDLQFTSPKTEVKQAIAELQGKVDAIVVIAHMGLENENGVPDTSATDIALENPQIDAIIAGHMHVKIDQENVNGVIITEPDKYAKALSRVDLNFVEESGKFKLVDKKSYTYDIKNITPDSQMQAIFAPYHEQLQAIANRQVAELVGGDLVAKNEIKDIPQVQIEDSGLSQLFHEASLFYAPKANVVALQIDNDRAKLDQGPIKAKDIAYNYQYAGGEITVYQMTGKELKAYMEWAADYFNQVKPGDVTYSFNPERRASKYSTNDFFGGVAYTIDLKEPTGNRIKELTLNDGTLITDETDIRLGMNSYRMGHLVKEGGVLAGKSFPILFDSKEQYGEEEGTIRNLTIRYLGEEKKGKYEANLNKRWQLSGIDLSDPNRKLVIELINRDLIDIPRSEDGKFTNIKSINIEGLIFKDKDAAQEIISTLQQQHKTANEADKKQIEQKMILIEYLNQLKTLS